MRTLLFERVLPFVWFCVLGFGSLVLPVRQIMDGADPWRIIRSMGNAAFVLLLLLLFLIRRAAVVRSRNPIVMIVALAGTFIPSLVIGLAPETADPLLLKAGILITLAGLAWSLMSLAALGRCFGILPDVRGMVTRGPYRVVRHPIYLGEIVTLLGISLASLSPLAMAGWFTLVGLQLWRIVYEERALSGAFPEYADYKRSTRRLVPFVW